MANKEYEMTIERVRTLDGFVRYDVWGYNTVIASFNLYFDAVDFIRFMEGIENVA